MDSEVLYQQKNTFCKLALSRQNEVRKGTTFKRSKSIITHFNHTCHLFKYS